MISFLTGTLGLLAMLILSAVLVAARSGHQSWAIAECQPAANLLLGAHVLHLTEETLTGFYLAFPSLLGLPAWPLWLFLGFNLSLIVVWLVCLRQVHGGYMTTVWLSFLALASALNGLAHPAFALQVNGYFPGLVTSPIVGGLGVWLLIRLYAATPKQSRD